MVMVPGGASSMVTVHHYPSIRSGRAGRKRKTMNARQWYSLPSLATVIFCHKVYPARLVLYHAMACQPISPSSAPDVCCTAQPTIRARCPCNDCPGISLHGAASLSRSRASNGTLSIALDQGALVRQLFVKARKCRIDAKRRASRLMRPRHLPIAEMAISRGLPVRPMPVRLADHNVLWYVPCWLTSSANAGFHVGCGGPKCLVVEVTYAFNVSVAFGGYLAFLRIGRYPPPPSQIGGYG
ncbi:hypothetical protein BO79DRAFT_230896 [Aspergillus costaricaensis CBS 115574]|uniref:Uncharacterized protein n=1 Tax=Aspergillus costaricaensis CBS 115574 TaxID=1448317 RepID=A0ACD1I772_9EURO|nr:hypothetical protein BO79DRAFT_230896 [Aspergillus costaricaensis CBS 115574]RAK86170.1 hypothetical protein BO79DRAFT_230896 [Aspergillus costaricaensis CBS 115574]